QRRCGSMSRTSIRTGHSRPSSGAARWITWPGVTGPGGEAETKRASAHSSNFWGLVRTLQIASGGAALTAAGHTLTITGRSLLVFGRVSDGGLRRGQSRHRDAERAARHVVQAQAVAQVDGVGVSAVLAADADLQP